MQPQRVAFAAPVRPQQKGYMYVWVSNESENTRVWFDDLKITHRSARVTQATDYYAWGGMMREQATNTLEDYRYGYQGQFAEKNKETGWNHFEMREYDPLIGRWTAVDPEKQYSSPYLGMGNNPIKGIDKKGTRVWFIYSELTLKLGFGPTVGAGAFFQKGTAFDNFGRVHYEISGSFGYSKEFFSTQGYNPETSKNWSLGGDIGAEFGFGVDWSSKGFAESISKWNFKVYSALPVDLSFGDSWFGVDIGASFGAAISSLDVKSVSFLAYTADEIVRATNGDFSSFDSFSLRPTNDGYVLDFVVFGKEQDFNFNSTIEVLKVGEGQYETAGYRSNRTKK